MPRRAGLVIIAVVVLAGCGGTAGPAASPTLPPAAITIEAGTKVAEAEGEGGYIFTPSKFEIHAGDIVRLVDVGNVYHNLTIDEGGGIQIQVDLVTRTRQAAINLPPGKYRFYCSIGAHAKSGMVGTITIT